MAKTLILCDCLGSQAVDRDAIGANAELVCTRIHTALCTREIEDAAKAIAGGEAIPGPPSAPEGGAAPPEDDVPF